MIGRNAELGQVRALLGGDRRLVTLTGPGGIGKTVLARAAAEEVHRLFPGGVAHLEVREVGVRDAEDDGLLLTAAARALGVRLPDGEVRVEHLCDAVADRPVLLVVDGCERLAASCAGMVAALLAGCPRLSVLVASRQLLGVAGETVVRLGPLAVPEVPGTGGPSGPRSPLPGPEELEELARSGSVALFVERARRVVPTFRLTVDNAAAVVGVCAAVEGVPLGVELAAARVGVLSPQGIVDRMHDRFRLLGKGAPDAPANLRSLRASVEVSHELCTPAEQALWARLAVFPGSFDLDAAEAVCAGEGVEVVEVLDLVDALLEKSVLGREEADAVRVRYRMPEPLRAYAEERLGEDARARWRERHLRWCQDRALRAAAAWFGPEQERIAAELRLDDPDLAAAVAHATATGRAGPALRMVAALGFHWLATGRLSEVRARLAPLVQAPEVPAPDLVAAEVLAGWFALFQRDAHQAARHLERAERAAREAGVTLPGGWLLADGAVTIAHGDVDGGIHRVEEGIRAARAAADPAVEATGLLLLGMCRGLLGEREEAAAVLRACVELTEGAGELMLRSYALGLVGIQALQDGELGIADEAVRQAVRIKARLGDAFAVAFLVDALACVAAALGDGDRSATLFGAAERQWRRLGVRVEDVAALAPLHAEGVAAARRLLGASRFETRCGLGGELDSAHAVRYAVDGVDALPERPVTDSPLTARETEVAALVAQGLTNREIAERLTISPRTVQGHVENILRKLFLSTRTQIATWVTRRGGTGAEPSR